MTAPNYVSCQHCGEKHNASGDYTSPANREQDRIWWQNEHLSGKCLKVEIAEVETDAHNEFSHDQISAALNQAADEVIDLDPSNEQLRDAINLVVNASLHYLTEPDASLQAAVEANYEEDFADELIAQIRG